MSGSIDGTPIQVTYSGSTNATLDQLASLIDALPSVSASSNHALKTVTITAAAAGTAFTASNFDIKTALPATLISGNVSAIAQSESITLPRALVLGDEITVVVNGSTVIQAYTGSSNATLTALNSLLNSGGVSASLSLATKTITLTAITPGVSFTVSNLQVINQISPVVLQNPIVPVKQVVQYTLANSIIAGDTITGTIDGQAVNVTFATTDTDALNSLASQIDGFTGVDATVNTTSRVLTVTAATA